MITKAKGNPSNCILAFVLNITSSDKFQTFISIAFIIRSSQYAAESSCRLRFGAHAEWLAAHGEFILKSNLRQ
jgi:hypothetical protein